MLREEGEVDPVLSLRSAQRQSLTRLASEGLHSCSDRRSRERGTGTQRVAGPVSAVVKLLAY
jgi:hypothetical protein